MSGRLLFIGLLLWGCVEAVAQSKPVPENHRFELGHKTFRLEIDRDTIATGQRDLQLLFIFQQEGRAIFRTQIGSKVIKDSPLRWGYAGDSLFIQASPTTFIVEDKKQIIERSAN